MDDIQPILARNNTEPHNYFLKLITILRNQTYGPLVALLLIYTKTKQYFSVNLKLIYKC